MTTIDDEFERERIKALLRWVKAWWAAEPSSDEEEDALDAAVEHFLELQAVATFERTAGR
jgi:hypothetical protein